VIPIKNSREIEAMRQTCRIAANVLDKLSAFVAPGVSTYDLDQEGRKLIEGYGARSACYNYQVGGRRYPGFTCLSVNEVVVHGIGSLQQVLREGDIVTLDICVVYNGWIGDNARTYRVGQVSPDVEHLLTATEEAMYKGIAKARRGNRVGDISNTVQRYVEERGLGVVREFVGHGVGRSMHEAPQLPNYGRRGTGERLAPGMTLCIEPMVTLGSPEVDFAPDGWTAYARDRKPAAHFEHTVLITHDEPEILTLPDSVTSDVQKSCLTPARK